MFKIKKIKSKFSSFNKLHYNVKTYIQATYDFEEYMASVFKFIFYALNIFSLLCVLVGSIITTLVLSKIIWDPVPNWFFFLIASVTAITTFITTIINFFLIKKTYTQCESNAIKIKEELLIFELHEGEYTDPETANLRLFDNIFSIRNEGYFVEDIQHKQELYRYDSK